MFARLAEDGNETVVPETQIVRSKSELRDAAVSLLPDDFSEANLYFSKCQFNVPIYSFYCPCSHRRMNVRKSNDATWPGD